MITFESLDVGSSYLHIRYIQGIRVKFIYEGQGRGYRSKKGRIYLFPQCKTLSGHNAGSIKHRAMRFACCMGFSAMADRMV